jgi:hypothetical protein
MTDSPWLWKPLTKRKESSWLEDGVAVVADGAGHAVAADRRLERLKVAGTVLLVPEDRAGGIVDVAHERESWSAAPEPAYRRVILASP